MSKKKKANNKILVWIVAIILVAIGVFAYFKWNTYMNPPCANSISCISDLSGKYEPTEGAVFLGRDIVAPRNIASSLRVTKSVLGESTLPKHIYVDLETQTLTAYEGFNKVYEFPVSTGKWGRTPTGTFKIWIKLEYTRMEGGSGSDYYNLPNVPHTMFFYNDEVAKSRGFSIHGAYWHNNFGYPMSHGCVNMRQVDAKTLFEWAEPTTESHTTYATDENPGTLVTIYGKIDEEYN